MKEENRQNQTAPAIEVRDLVIDFGETLAVDNISFKVYPGELVTLLGPSGCGKTTTLNALAGLLTPTSGQILFKGQDVTKYSPQDRKLGLVFQNYALYPHMSVYKNIAFPLSNDQVWKNKVIHKNELAKLEILSIILKKNGANSEQLSLLKKKFDDIDNAKKELNIKLQKKESECNQQFFEAKTQYQLVDIHRNSELVSEARKVFDLLKQHKQKVDEIITRIKITNKKKKILSSKKDKNPEIIKRIKDYQADLKVLVNQKQDILKNNKKELKIAKKHYESATKKIKKEYRNVKVVAEWKLKISKKMKEVETGDDLRKLIIPEITSSLKREHPVLTQEKLLWILRFKYPKNNLSDETINKIDKLVAKAHEVFEFLVDKLKKKFEIVRQIKKEKAKKNIHNAKELSKQLSNFLEEENIKKVRMLKEILQEKNNEDRVAKENAKVLQNKIKEMQLKNQNNKYDAEIQNIHKQIIVITNQEKLDNPKNKIAEIKKLIKEESKNRLTDFKEYKTKLISKYSLDRTNLTDKENEKIYQIEKRIISISTAIKNAVLEVAERVNIIPNLAKKPTALSGGQQQRVAIARAIVKNPDVLLMDEPLSNLDAKLRISTREWIRRIQKELGMTTIFVTHDQEEAMSISDRIINMSTGVIQQIGSPMELYLKPKNKFVATFLGMPEMMIYRAKVVKGKVMLNSKVIGEIKDSTLNYVDVGIRAEHLRECSKNEAIITGKIEHLEYLGKEILAQLKLENNLEGKIFLKNKDHYELGETVYATANQRRFHFFSPDTEERIK